MKILYAESDFWPKHREFQQRYEAKIERAFAAARRYFPELPEQVTFVLQTNDFDCIPETGDGASTNNSRLIILTVDPGLPYGEEALLQQIRPRVFHELNHAARFEFGRWHKDFLDSCIMEGLATIFERDYAKADPLWGRYDPVEAADWLAEIQAADNHPNFYEYMFRHSDGRRWIGYKVGCYIIDTAKQRSKLSGVELTKLECSEILRLAEIER